MPKFYKCQECLRTVRTVSKFLCIISATSGHHQGPFKASSAPLEGIISAFSGHHQGHFRASSAPLQGIISTISGRHRTNTAWTVSVVPLQKKHQGLHHERSRRSPSCPSQRQISGPRGPPAAFLSNQSSSQFSTSFMELSFC